MTHLKKIIFPQLNVTKEEVLLYYEKIAPRLLPYLKDRPVALERLAEGWVGEDSSPLFWQKNIPDLYPNWIPRIEIPTAQGKKVHYALVQNVETLLYLVNKDCLTFHIWLSRIKNLERPDFVLFDIDPGEGAFKDVVKVAQVIRSLLEEKKCHSYIKTSGKTGLHIFSPWLQKGGFDESRKWASSIAAEVNHYSDLATLKIRKNQRKGRVYIDVFSNVKGHHVASPYVLRAIPEALVSTPLERGELTDQLDPCQFNIKTIFNRFSHQPLDPMISLLG